MAKNMAFVFMTCQPNQLMSSISQLSREIRNTNKKLFLCLAPQFGKNMKCHYPPILYSHKDISDILRDIYQIFENQFNGKNIYLLLKNLFDANNINYNICDQEYHLISDSKIRPGLISNYLYHHYNYVTENQQKVAGINNFGKYSTVAVGGTFDRLHNGHKLLLSECCLLTQSKLIVGITSREMMEKKELSCLIEDFDKRSRSVLDFCRTIMPSIEVVVTQLDTRYGPAALNGEIECLVVTEETVKFTTDLNQIRKKNGCREVDIHTVDLISSACGEKLSSTMIRKNILGTLIAEPVGSKHSEFEGKPYFVGLTGCSCSGKTSIGRQFSKLGAGHIDLDKIAHETYNPGTAVYHEIVRKFGVGIVSDDGTINRKELGKIVFRDRNLLDQLTCIVRPATREVAFERARALWEKGCRVVIFDGAVIIEANFHLLMNELWVAVLERDLAVGRLAERNHMDLEEAKLRLDAQGLDSEFVKKANVVFCSKWDYSETKAQIDKTWARLIKYFE